MKELGFNMFKKYLKIYQRLIANSLSYEAQYRHDTWIKMFANLLWVGMLFVIIEVIFSQTMAIAGWSKSEIYLLTVFWVMIDELYVTFFGNNIPNLSELITQGTLDSYLTKPLAPLFFVSCKIFLTRSFYRFLTQLLILGWLVMRFDFAVSPAHIILSLLLIIVGVSVSFSMTLIANTLSFWFLRIDNINNALGMVVIAGRYPLGIWPKTFKIIFLTILPVTFTGFIPVATLTGRWPWQGILYAFIFALLLFLIAVRFWNFALTRYSSASS